MLAIILAAGRQPKIRVLIWVAAVAVTAVAGASQVYLGADWLTDVLGGWALGALWTAIILVADVLITLRRQRSAAARRPNAWRRRAQRATRVDGFGGFGVAEPDPFAAFFAAGPHPGGELAAGAGVVGDDSFHEARLAGEESWPPDLGR
jgi:hypothetical protein